jgi:glutamine synthetase
MPALCDAENPGCVSNVGGSFVAGILQHLPALIAFTAPSPISGLRLLPHQWSASYTWFGNQDREASLRICPVPRIGKSDPAKAFNIEYRPADATACPHLALWCGLALKASGKNLAHQNCLLVIQQNSPLRSASNKASNFCHQTCHQLSIKC